MGSKKSWRDVLPQRGDIDSWATRLGGVAIIQVLFKEVSNTPNPFSSLLLLAIIILTCFAVIPAWNMAVQALNNDSENKLFSKSSVIQLATFVMLIITPFIAFPSLGALINTILSDYGTKLITVAVGIFTAGFSVVSYFNKWRKRSCVSTRKDELQSQLPISIHSELGKEPLFVEPGLRTQAKAFDDQRDLGQS